MAIRGRLATDAMDGFVAVNAAPFAGMTQTGLLTTNKHNTLAWQTCFGPRLDVKELSAAVANPQRRIKKPMASHVPSASDF